MPVPSQPIQVNCPRCGQPFMARIQTVIDVKEAPHLKDELLSGRLNMTRCPSCGAQGYLGAPLLYHDPDKELCLCLVPFELQLTGQAQERLVGAMTNALMEGVPQEERRAYMFQPQVHVSMQSFIEAVLLADGVTPEVLETRRERVKLIGELAAAADDEMRLQALVDEHRDELDYDFFIILSGLIESTEKSGDQQTSWLLRDLYEGLLPEVGGPGDKYLKPWPEDMSHDEMIKTLLEAPEVWLPRLVEVNRIALDYAFFETLAERIETAGRRGGTPRQDELETLRDRLLNLTMEFDRRVAEAIQEAASLLRFVLYAEDPKQAIRDNLDRIDELFLAILASNIREARAQGADDAADFLEGLYGYTLSQLEALMPADLRLLNRLLRLADGEQRAAVMDEESELVTPGFLEMVRALGDSADREGDADLSRRLATVASEVEARLEAEA